MTSEPVTNSDVFIWALFELGGADDFVDVEHVFLRSFDLAPQRLSWRTRPDLPDLKKCSKGMRDAEKRSPTLFVKKGTDLRRLSAEGQKWIEENFDRLADSLGKSRIVQPPKGRNATRLLSSLARSDLFESWMRTRSVEGEKWQFAELFRCSPDSSRSIWSNRLETLRSAAYAAGRHDLLDFLDAVARDRSAWFREGKWENTD